MFFTLWVVLGMKRGEWGVGVWEVLEANPKEPELHRQPLGHNGRGIKWDFTFVSGFLFFALFIVSGKQTAFSKLEDAL